MWISRSVTIVLIVAGVSSPASPLYSEGLSASSVVSLSKLRTGQRQSGPPPALQYDRRKGDTDDRPRFPDEEEIRQIKHRTRARGYPTLSANLGLAFRFHNQTSLNQTFDRVEDYYGVETNRSFANPAGTFSLGVRLHATERFAMWWEYVFGDTESRDAGRVGDKMSVSSVSFSALYTLRAVRGRGLQVSVGAGLALQKLKAIRAYQHSVADDGTLEEISLATDRRTGVPLIALFEFVNSPGSGPAAFFLSARYILASRYSEHHVPMVGGYYDGPVEADMNGFLVTFGLVFNP